MNIVKRALLILLISVSCVGCDQSTKTLAGVYLPKDKMDSFFFDTLRVGYTENVGSFLNLGADLPEETRFLLLTIFTGIILIGLLIYLIAGPRLSSMGFLGLCLFFAGGISNLYDRATNNGAVIDFLNIGIGPIRTGIFNIADVALMPGAVIVLYSTYRATSLEERKNNETS